MKQKKDELLTAKLLQKGYFPLNVWYVPGFSWQSEVGWWAEFCENGDDHIDYHLGKSHEKAMANIEKGNISPWGIDAN